MTTYIAMIRGINVGGKNIIKMADLKRMSENLGLFKVQTYIQSGNILFESDEEEEVLRIKIENQIERVFGFPAAVILRTSQDMEKIIRNCPFSEEAILEAKATSEGESIYVALLQKKPLPEKIELLNSYRSTSDEFQINGREVFLLFHKGIRKSKLAINLHKLEVPATVRNWNTINKLFELAKARKV